MREEKHLVTIKGTKDGLTFILDDHCLFEDLIGELQQKLSQKHYQNEDDPDVRVNVVLGNRYVNEDQQEQIIKTITEGKNLIIEKIKSNVITKEEAEAIRKEKQVHSLARIVRSGQVLEVEGDLLLIGDINPGGTVISTGNIYVLGAIRGMAHAGSLGNRDAVICASIMAPSQLRIADLMKEEPDRAEQEEREMECAYIDEKGEEIVFNKIQLVKNIRPQLTVLPY